MVNDNRETRVFDPDRYELSPCLPQIVRELSAEGRQCQYADPDNYVTVDLGAGVRYGVFFKLMRWRKHGPDTVLLMVQSALDPDKPEPGRGKYAFNKLVGDTLRQESGRVSLI